MAKWSLDRMALDRTTRFKVSSEKWHFRSSEIQSTDSLSNKVALDNLSNVLNCKNGILF
jgi:hypothetical protein